jgi:DnaK suppressor protein
MLDVFLKMVGIRAGHKAGKSLQSRATSKSVEAAKSGITRSYAATGVDLEDIKPQATAARRQEVKAPAKKSNVVKKASKATAKPAPKAKPPVKAAPKAASKSVAQPAVKKTAQPASKSAAKKVVKAKPVAKKALVKSVKSAVKPQAKPPEKGQTVAKPAAKKSAAKPATKSVVKPATKPVAPKSAAKPQQKISAKASPQVPTNAPRKASIKQPDQPAVTASVKVPAKSSPAAVVASPKLVATPPVQKITKAGSRVVPSYAPSAANLSPHGGNTAAKASFTMSLPVLAPPPQVVIKKDPKLVGNWKTKSPEQLSDQEVIAMPDSEYMNAKQLAFFRLKLVALKNGILANAGETTEHLREDTSIVPDPADRATIEEEHALELRTRDRERKLLKKIEQSIASIDADEYGYCDETGEPIGVARLIARPTATLSLEAQQRRELKQKMFGD